MSSKRGRRTLSLSGRATLEAWFYGLDALERGALSQESLKDVLKEIQKSDKWCKMPNLRGYVTALKSKAKRSGSATSRSVNTPDEQRGGAMEDEDESPATPEEQGSPADLSDSSSPTTAVEAGVIITQKTDDCSSGSESQDNSDNNDTSGSSQASSPLPETPPPPTLPPLQLSTREDATRTAFAFLRCLGNLSTIGSSISFELPQVDMSDVSDRSIEVEKEATRARLNALHERLDELLVYYRTH